jgi:undecaprenyl pyrophosphate phosphatase UppP
MCRRTTFVAFAWYRIVFGGIVLLTAHRLGDLGG